MKIISTITVVTVLVSMASPIQAAVDYSKLETKPAKNSVNQGLTSPSASFMKSKLGTPGELTDDCSVVTDKNLQKLMILENVGPFRVTGLKEAVASLKKIFAKVKSDKPALYDQLGSSGMLCVRKVRGSSSFSNHSWGTAIDININKKLDAAGDKKTQVGLKELYPYFHAEGFYWGATFPTEDSMHFEASQELIEKWKK